MARTPRFLTEAPWNVCDVCKHFIPFRHFDEGRAVRRLVTPSADGTKETWETLCETHKHD